MNQPFYISSKPMGSVCNLDCHYCYYLEKSHLYPKKEKHLMSDEMLEHYVKAYISESQSQEVVFTWHGGEPLLQKIEFYRKAVALQHQYAKQYRKRVMNSLQTNGTLLNDEWVQFFAEHRFLIGLSIDGPEHLHDYYRKNKNGSSSFQDVMQGLNYLKKYQVEFNILATVNSYNVHFPEKVYQFFKAIGARYIQFTPIVEREFHQAKGHRVEQSLASVKTPNTEAMITEWTVNPLDYGKFLNRIFDEWVAKDIGEIYVINFDAMLANWYGIEPPICIFAKKCGHAIAMEYTGDIYSCDHFVFEEYKLGNLQHDTLKKMLQSPEQQKFGNDKQDNLPTQCRQCDYLFACNGECPKNRFMHTSTGEGHLNYLCEGFQLFYRHIDPYMKFMVEELKADRSPSNIRKKVNNIKNIDLT
jgi:uncharacterized protein